MAVQSYYGPHLSNSDTSHKSRSLRPGKWDPPPSTQNPGLQAAHNSISVRDYAREHLAEHWGKKWHNRTFVYPLPQPDVDLLTDPVALANYYRDPIQEQVDRRAAQFFLQAVCCAGTEQKYEVGPTEGQILSAPKFHIRSERRPDEKITIHYQAAHSSTLPALETQNDLYLKGSHLDRLSNSTRGLPTFVNQVDILVDGKSSGSGLRSRTIKLINDVAVRKLDPCMATVSFLDAFDEELDKVLVRHPELSAEKRVVVELYKRQIKNIRSEISIGPDFVQGPLFDAFLNLNLYRERMVMIPYLRYVFYVQKMILIRIDETMQSDICHQIEHLFGELTPHEYHKVELGLVHNCRSRNTQKILEKLFSVSQEAITKDAALSKELVKNYKANQRYYDAIIDLVEREVQNFRQHETNCKVRALYDLAASMYRWDKERFEKELSITFSEMAHTISRDEMHQIQNGIFSRKYAEIAAQTLGIKPHHFDFSYAFSAEG